MGPDLLWGFLAGVVIAAVTTPVGVSGAVFVLLPFQISVLGVPSPSVTPTNLLYNVLAVPGGLLRFARGGSLRSPLTRSILCGTVPGVVAGALVRVFLLPDGTVFRILVAALLLPMGCWLLLRGEPPGGRERLPKGGVVVALGLTAGFVGGIYGIGGGALLAPVLVGLGYTAVVVAPATLVATFVTSCVGVATYITLGLLGQPQAAPVLSVAVACGLGGLVGGYLGASVQSRVPGRVLGQGLGGLCVALAVAYGVAVLGG